MNTIEHMEAARAEVAERLEKARRQRKAIRALENALWSVDRAIETVRAL